jgi:hypothetical protein
MPYRKINHMPEAGTLRSLYWDVPLSLNQVGLHLGLSGDTVRALMKSFGIPLRDRKTALRMQAQTGRSWAPQPRKELARNWKGGRRKARGYIELHDPSHPRARGNGYVAEHIVIWERHHGTLPDGWHIHHVNGVKDDNRIENLQGMPSKDHMSYIAMQCQKIRELENEISRLKANLEKD